MGRALKRGKLWGKQTITNVITNVITSVITSYHTMHNKQLLDEVFVICGIIIVEVRVIISRAKGEADNSYRDIDNFAYHKNRIQ